MGYGAVAMNKPWAEPADASGRCVFDGNEYGRSG